MEIPDATDFEIKAIGLCGFVRLLICEVKSDTILPKRCHQGAYSVNQIEQDRPKTSVFIDFIISTKLHNNYVIVDCNNITSANAMNAHELSWLTNYV